MSSIDPEPIRVGQVWRDTSGDYKRVGVITSIAGDAITIHLSERAPRKRGKTVVSETTLRRWWLLMMERVP